MYDQEEISPLRRILWVIVTFVIIFAVLWGIVWVLFLRHSTPVAKQPEQNKNSSTHSGSKQQPSHSSSTADNGASNTGNSNSNNSGSPAPTTTTQPTELANTGAGDVVALFAGVTVVSGVAYQIRLRKKLLA